MTCCPYGIQNNKKSHRNSLFPEASQMIFSWNQVPVVSPPSVFHPSGHSKLLSPLGVRQLWLNLQTENIFCWYIYGCFCWPSHILPCRNRTAKPTQQEELIKRKRIRNSLIFCSLCKHQTPWCKCWKLK